MLKHRSNVTSIEEQQGDALLESLFGLLLMSLVGLGLIHATFQAERSHSEIKSQGLAIAQMRSLLQNSSPETLCASAPSIYMPDGSSINLTVSCTQPSVSVEGVSINAPPEQVYLTTQNQTQDCQYFGGVLAVGEYSSDQQDNCD